MGRIIGLCRLFHRDLAELLFAIINPKTPGKIRGGMLLVLLYLFSPIDLIPDSIPVLGIMDDAVLVPMAIGFLMRMLPERVKADSEIKAWRYRRYVPVVMGIAGFLLLSWILAVFYGLYRLIFT